jgi:hypothetical protein
MATAAIEYNLKTCSFGCDVKFSRNLEEKTFFYIVNWQLKMDIQSIGGAVGASQSSANQVSDIIKENTTNEMEEVKNERNLEILVHKDQLVESTKYLSKKDVYEIFKVI